MRAPISARGSSRKLVKRNCRTSHNSKTCGILLTVAVMALAVLFPGLCRAQTAETYRKQAIEYSKEKSWDQAIANYREALKLEPNDAVTHYDLALALKYSGTPAQAVLEFQSALKLKPKWAEAHYGLGATYFDLHDPASAIKELKTAEALQPGNVEANRLLARIYSKQNDAQDAVRELRGALAAKPSAELYVELGLAEAQLGNSEAAAREFRRALQLDPRYANAHMILGVILRRQGDHAGALAQFRKAAELAPDDPEAQFNLGKELKADGDKTGAIAAFRRAIELKPDYEQAHYNLGLTLHAQGENAEAKKELSEVSGLHDYRIHLSQTKLLILQGVDELKKKTSTRLSACFRKQPSAVRNSQRVITTWELFMSVKRIPRPRFLIMKKRSPCSRITRRRTQVTARFFGG